MDLQAAKEEYALALRMGQKETKELAAAEKECHPAVLDELLADGVPSVRDLGLLEIPAERIVGTKSAGRITAFSPSFRPLLASSSEFATKWVALCAAHLDEGIRDPIVCYEYLGNFYVQEGNKRVSVLRHFDAPRIPALVTRVMPPVSEEPRIKAYYEFLEFYSASRLYCVQFRRPGDYARLLACLGKDPDERWEESERRTFSAYFLYFREAYRSLKVSPVDILPEEALLLWLKVHPYKDLGRLSAAELKKTLEALWPDVVTSSTESAVTVRTEPVEEAKSGILNRFISSAPGHIHVAFVHQMSKSESSWVLGHEEGRKHIEEVFGDKITVRSYYNANTPAQREQMLEQAVADGANVVFSTAPTLSQATLKIAVKYPKVHFLTCSVDQPYSSMRTYYGRIFEAKFITGAIAGAVAQDDRIGYIGSSPILGVAASINAFALGAQMTNPRAQIDLRWSCCEGTPQADFYAEGIRVVSNRDVPTQNQVYMNFCNYGTYLLGNRSDLIPLASPLWLWGKFYEHVISSLLAGTWKDDKRSQPKAVNYWLGMDSGVIDVEFSNRLPAGVLSLANILRDGLRNKTIQPFRRRILAQDGTIKNDGSRDFTTEELLHMDWLCENVVGGIPRFDELLPMAQPLVRELGIYRDKIPAVKERVE